MSTFTYEKHCYARPLGHNNVSFLEHHSADFSPSLVPFHRYYPSHAMLAVTLGPMNALDNSGPRPQLS